MSDVLRVADVAVQNCPTDEVVEKIVNLADEPQAELCFALHIGGITHHGESRFLQLMSQASITYADGISVVVLARRLAKSVREPFRMERASTTDIGARVLQRLSVRRRRPVRIALVGGPPGLSSRAGEALSASCPVIVTIAEHGYQDDWTEVLEKLRDADPDVVFVGMGAPREMEWCVTNRRELPRSLVLTCGGWFSFLAGEERRAPKFMRDLGMEWIMRLGQDPRRLFKRYAVGIFTVARLYSQYFLVQFGRGQVK